MNVFNANAVEQGPISIKPSEGTIPHDLNGIYIKNGPGALRVGDRILDHWFDGFAYLQQFKFTQGELSYQSKYLSSKGYLAAKESGSIKYPLFSSVPKFKWYEYIIEFFRGRQSGHNSAVSVVKMGGRYFALTESKGMSEIDIDTLEYLGQFEFEDELNKKSKISTAHPLYDKENDTYINFEATPGPNFKFTYFSVDNKNLTRKEIGSTSSRFPSYIHAFGMTPNYIIHIDYPLVIFPVSLKIRFGWVSYAKSFIWKPEFKTKISLINRSTGNIDHVFETDPCFAFHNANAYEEDGKVIFDLCEYPSHKIIGNLESKKLLSKQNRTIEENAVLTRYQLDLADKSLTKHILLDKHIEMPTFNANYRCAKNNFYYGVSSNKDTFDNSIIKFDVTNNTFVEWSEDNCFASEPVFVEKDSSSSEDDGYIISLVHSAKFDQSFLLCLDSKNFEEVCRVKLPGESVPSTHGEFFRG